MSFKKQDAEGTGVLMGWDGMGAAARWVRSVATRRSYLRGRRS